MTRQPVLALLLLSSVPTVSLATEQLSPECRSAVNVVTAAATAAIAMAGKDTKDKALELTLDMDSVMAKSCGMSPEEAKAAVQVILKTAAFVHERPPATRITQEQFDNSKVGGMYTCREIAINTARQSAALTFLRGIAYIRREDPAVDALHDDYVKMARYQARRIDADGKTNAFYKFACSEAESNIQRGIQNGTIK